MNKRAIIWFFVVAVVACTLTVLFFWQQSPTPDIWVSEQDVADQIKRLGGGHEIPTPAAAVPVELKRPIRLAIGGLGQGDDEQNGRLDDLVLAGLTGARGLELVERQSLESVLRELNLSLSGLVRAGDAVRVGKLLKADWFLLGSTTKINGTNLLVVRAVDAHTGIVRDAKFFPNGSPVKLAPDIAKFVQQCRQDAATPKPRMYLAIGAFQDLSLNDRQAGFPAQLRGYLTAAFQGTQFTLLEREAVDVLLQEVRLDLAGLTQDNGTNAPATLQSAFWLVDGDYQSYETTNFQVEVVLNINRMFGRRSKETFRGPPDEHLFQGIKAAIEKKMKQDTSPVVLSRVSEAHAQMFAGKELAGKGSVGLTFQDYYAGRDQPEAAQRRRNVTEAIHAFEAALLLEPTNREAKLYLAACLRSPNIGRVGEARVLYRDLLDEPRPDKWTGQAKQALVFSFEWVSPEEKARWYAAAVHHNTNSPADEFYRQNAEGAAKEVTIDSHQGKAAELAQKRLLESIRSCKNFLDGKGGGYGGAYGLYDFRNAFSDKAEAARAMADFLPKMEAEFPELAPHLAGEVLPFQVDTNSPALPEFEKTLDWCIAHPKDVYQPTHYWHESVASAFDWLTEHQQSALAVKTMEGWRAAASQKVIEDFGEGEQIELGYAYIGAERWKDALDIFETFSNRSVQVAADGPWGRAFQPVLTDKLSAFCRGKLGLAVTQNPRQFDLGKPVLCLCSPSTFVADEDGLWVGIDGRLLHLDLDLKTNLVVNLPIDKSVPVSVIRLAANKIWLGTSGAGLIEFDKASRRRRRFTQADGLLTDNVSSLQVTSDSLWIGYGGATGGGLGRLDLHSQKFMSFMATLDPVSRPRVGDDPPHGEIGCITADANGDLRMKVGAEVRQYHVARDLWETLPIHFGDWVACISADSTHWVEGVSISLQEIEISTIRGVKL